MGRKPPYKVEEIYQGNGYGSFSSHVTMGRGNRGGDHIGVYISNSYKNLLKDYLPVLTKNRIAHSVIDADSVIGLVDAENDPLVGEIIKLDLPLEKSEKQQLEFIRKLFEKLDELDHTSLFDTEKALAAITKALHPERKPAISPENVAASRQGARSK